MRIINVLKTDKGLIDESYSFVVYDDTKSFDIIKAAEDKFIELVSQEDDELTEKDLYDCLDACNYSNYDGVSIDFYFSDEVIEQ